MKPTCESSLQSDPLNRLEANNPRPFFVAILMDVIDPVQFVALNWPEIVLYDKQREIMYSVRDNDETFVPAGNQLGKDFVSALIALWFFCSRRPAKVVTTSVKGDQLNDVLWGEIRRLVESSKYELPIQFNHLRIRQRRENGTLVGNAELVGQVVKQGEALLGRHLARGKYGLPRTLCIFDEASGMETSAYESSDTWAHRKLVIGNCYPCSNFFFNGVEGGDLKRPNSDTFYRKVIRITAEDSPNVQLAQAEQKVGKPISYEELVPGVLPYDTYVKRRTLWDSVRQCIGLDARFWKGSEVLLFPPSWLDHAEALYHGLGIPLDKRKATHMGIDPAEGGDSTAWSIIDDFGLIEMLVEKTPDTTVIVERTIELMRKHSTLLPENVLIDRGGGGKQHADRLRKMGFNIRTVAFGEAVKSENRYRFRPKSERKADDEEAYVYKNRRAEMYWLLRQRFDPNSERPFSYPPEYIELRRQLAPLPLLYDPEGRIMLPPKNKKDPDSKQQTIVEILGCSPDESDSLVLANYGASVKLTRLKAG